MFSAEKWDNLISDYKEHFVPMEWGKEAYKWKILKHFQEHWDIMATDFPKMLEESLSRTGNLLSSVNHFPARMITTFAKMDPEAVRAMYLDLFDESKDLYFRISHFKDKSGELLNAWEKESGKAGRAHYQDENSISTYLWLRYPDRYYIYKLSEIRKVAEELDADYSFKKGDYANNIRNFMSFYDEIRDRIQNDEELIQMFRSQLTDDCYPDPQCRTLTFDFGFYVSRYVADRTEPVKVNKETEAINSFNEEMKDGSTKATFDANSLKSNARFKQWIYPVVIALRELGGTASRTAVHDKIWELYLSESEEADAVKINNDIDWARHYLNYEGILDPLSAVGIWSLSRLGETIKISDDLAGMIIAKWIRIKTAERNGKKRPIIDLTPYYEHISDSEGEQLDSYTEKDFLNEVFMEKNRYRMLVQLIRHKKNVIFQGAPGVGKTFAAKRLAYSMMGEKDDSRIAFIQFHQNYSYEDFIMGYKPDGAEFSLKEGIFYSFCQKAANHPEKEYFFIIDEINRGNLSKIFGELLMLIESDYREYKAILAYSGRPFSVPANLYIIGMMNTADRSLAMIDYALRRRFSFFTIEPSFDSEGFKAYQESLHNETFDALIAQITELNQTIQRDDSLGAGFCIGHSYFCLSQGEQCTEEWMRGIVEFDIIPMLQEYWFDNRKELQRWINNLNGVFSD